MNYMNVSIFAISLSVAGCANNKISPESLPQFRIANVEVALASDANYPFAGDIANTVRSEAKRHAAVYSANMPSGAQSRSMTITVDKVNYLGVGSRIVSKLLVGTEFASTISGTVTIGSKQQRISFGDSYSYQGLHGGIGQRYQQWYGKEYIAARLATGLANAAVNAAYGQKITPRFVQEQSGPTAVTGLRRPITDTSPAGTHDQTQSHGQYEVIESGSEQTPVPVREYHGPTPPLPN